MRHGDRRGNETLDETDRRRAVQLAYNLEHDITPRGTTRSIDDPLVRMAELDYYPLPEVAEDGPQYDSDKGAKAEIARLRRLIREASERLDFAHRRLRIVTATPFREVLRRPFESTA